MKRILILFSIGFGLGVYGQNIHFLKTYGNSGYDYGRDIKQTLDTGYIATGSSSSFSTGTADAFLLKVDSLGNFKWSHSYGGLGSEWGEKVILANDSSFALAGYTNSFGEGGFDFYLVRTNIDGSPRWEKTYGGSDWDRAYSLVQLPDSGFVIVGETYSYGSGNLDAYIVRTDSLGDTLWTKTWGGAEDDFFKGVYLDGDSLVFVGGTESFGAGMKDGVILKTDLDFNIGWEKIIGKSQNDYFTSIKKFNNDYYLSGTRAYNYDIARQDFWMFKISDDGLLVDADTTYASIAENDEIAHDIAIEPFGNIYYCGATKSFGYPLIDGEFDAFDGKFLTNYYSAESLGNFGEEGRDELYGIDTCFDLGHVCVGDLYYASTGGYNVVITKFERFFTYPDDIADFDIFDPTIINDITLSLDPISVKESIHLFPNPSSGELYIQGNENVDKIEIYDLNGQLILNQLNPNSFIDISCLAKQTYIITLYTNESVYQEKLILI